MRKEGQKVVIVGAGHGAAHLITELLRHGFPGEIVLIGAESCLPYQRPPLSKAFLGDDGFDESRLHMRAAAFYEEARVSVKLGVRVVSIDREQAVVHLADGSTESYGQLVLAMGARARDLDIPGRSLRRIGTLRGIDDARRLRDELADCRHLVVVGGGFVGLEVASTASKRGVHVTVLEAGTRLLARSVSPTIAQALHQAHVSAGVDVRLQTQASAFEGDDTVRSVVCPDGQVLHADSVLIGVGSVPETELATQAGLAVDRNGIVVDETGRTSDPAIFAIGDCAVVHDSAVGRLVRHESVQCALDQAAIAAACLGATAAIPRSAPWFWSEQHRMRLQIAGLALPDDQTVVRHTVEDAFSEFYLRDGRLVAVAAINRPADAAMVRKALAVGAPGPDPERLADARIPLNEVLA
ncbi:3-phenylpropionate/trans-cinnamate dioxygenase ferredoxin reductase subunit [Burkholderia sp. D7]|nr:3-phenylpropionate/trans-cinnamate dioxygenase ferredoxin reductase subunit [Burkholderia sp. D7]